MPPRLNKRQMRELEELQQLASEAVEDEAEDDAAQSDSAERSTPSAFAALIEGSNDQDRDDEDEEEQIQVVTKKSKSSKKKKKPTAAVRDEKGSPSTPPVSMSSKKSKAKAGAQGKEAPIDDEMDDLDRALADLGMAPARASPAIKDSDPQLDAIKVLFAIDPKHLDAEAELRRFFGSKLIGKSSATPPRSGHHARFANNPHHSTSIRRTASYLATPEAGWAPLAANGLTISRWEEADTSEGGKGEWYTYEHSTEYRKSQFEFLRIIQQSADGNRLFDVLEQNPYSVDTLLQLSEMSNQQGDLGAASTYLSKALYALSGPLPSSFLSGTFRLPYSRVENRSFYLAVARKVALLVKRGTWRTAMEWSKIALGAGLSGDHIGMLLIIDFLAPKSRQDAWFLSFLETIPPIYPLIKLESYPGLAYAKALCLRNIEEDDKSQNDEKSTAALRSAILRFPMVVSLLYASLDGNLPPVLVSNRRAQLDGRYSPNPTYLLSMLSELYVIRSSPLWKEPANLAWLCKTVNSTAASIDNSDLEDVRIGEKLYLNGPWESGYAPAGIIRAVFISDIPAIRPYLPPAALAGDSYSYDPLPPVGPANTYFDSVYFSPVYALQSRRPTRAQVRSQAENRQRALQRAREGIAQLANLLGMGNDAPIDLTDELREQLMREWEQAQVMVAQLEAGGRREEDLPGGWSSDYSGEEDEDEEEVDGEQEPVEAEGEPARQGVLPAVMDRLFGLLRG